MDAVGGATNDVWPPLTTSTSIVVKPEVSGFPPRICSGPVP